MSNYVRLIAAIVVCFYTTTARFVSGFSPLSNTYTTSNHHHRTASYNTNAAPPHLNTYDHHHHQNTLTSSSSHKQQQKHTKKSSSSLNLFPEDQSTAFLLAEVETWRQYVPLVVALGVITDILLGNPLANMAMAPMRDATIDNNDDDVVAADGTTTKKKKKKFVKNPSERIDTDAIVRQLCKRHVIPWICVHFWRKINQTRINTKICGKKLIRWRRSLILKRTIRIEFEVYFTRIHYM